MCFILPNQTLCSSLAAGVGMAPQITGSMTLLCSKRTGQSNLPKLFCRSNYCRLQTSCGHPPCEPFCSVLYTLYTTAELTYLRCLLFPLDMSPSLKPAAWKYTRNKPLGNPPQSEPITALTPWHKSATSLAGAAEETCWWTRISLCACTMLPPSSGCHPLIFPTRQSHAAVTEALR